MATDRIHLPPAPSLPEEAPWRELEQIIDLLKALIAALRGVPVTELPPTVVAPPVPIEEIPAPVETPPEEVMPPPAPDQEAIVARLDGIYANLRTISENVEGLASRLDLTNYSLGIIGVQIPRIPGLLDDISAKLDTLGVIPALDPVTSLLDDISGKLDTLIGLPPGAPLVTVPTIELDGRLDALVKYAGSALAWGTATGGTTGSLLDRTKSWETGIWEGFEIAFLRGTGAGQNRIIRWNTRDRILPRTDWEVRPDTTTEYIIRTNRTILGNKMSFAHGQKDVSDAGAAEQLADQEVPDGCQLTIIAKPGNAGTIYLGSSKALAELSTMRFDGLDAGVAVSLKVTNANKVWVDASSDGDGVSYIVEKAVK